LAPTAQAAFNAGIAWDAADARAPAANALTRALDLGELSTEEVREASRRLGRLVPTLGKLVLAAPSGAKVRVGDLERSVPGVIYVVPGEHALVAMLAGGTTRRQTLRIGAGEARTVSFDAPEPPKPAERPATPARAPDVDDEPTPVPKVLGFTALGVGAVAAGAGVVLNLRGAAANDEYEDSGRRDLGARDRAVDLRTAAFVAYGVGAAFGAVGIVLLATSDEKETQSLELGPASVAYRVRF
jgi:hypothetical protein